MRRYKRVNIREHCYEQGKNPAPPHVIESTFRNMRTEIAKILVELVVPEYLDEVLERVSTDGKYITFAREVYDRVHTNKKDIRQRIKETLGEGTTIYDLKTLYFIFADSMRTKGKKFPESNKSLEVLARILSLHHGENFPTGGHMAKYLVYHDSDPKVNARMNSRRQIGIAS